MTDSRVRAGDAAPADHWSCSGYEKGRKTRLLIVEKASKLFAAQGYDATSIEQIARAAGLTKGAAYAHFRRKRALYLACLENSFAFFLRAPIEPDPALAAEEALGAFLRWLGARLSKQSNARSFFIQIIRDQDDDAGKIAMIRSLMSKPYARLRTLIERTNPHADSGAFAFLAFSSLLLDHDLHRFHVLMAGKSARSHNLDTTVSQLVASIKSFRALG